MKKVAILYQAKPPPLQNGIQKPMKKGGYSDSGADIAFALRQAGIEIITPVANPQEIQDFDWVFPDSAIGIRQAIAKGATAFWLNTVLYSKHPIEQFFNFDLEWVGQLPAQVEIFDDKWHTNQLLRAHHLPIPKATLISNQELNNDFSNLAFPMVVKPIRGRGSQGVKVVADTAQLKKILQALFQAEKYGTAVYIEPYLEGQEITISVMPAGKYQINGQAVTYEKPWCLPAVRRFNHQNGIAPYSGVVAVSQNSAVLENWELESEAIQTTYKHCIKAAALIGMRAPIRIDGRADENGNYFLFDVNLKPNMTGAVRSHRKNQNSLTVLAAQKIGWSYADLLKNILAQSWKV